MVRISKCKSAFTKGYEANFTEELFKVIKVICGYPNVYEIEDLEGEPIIESFMKRSYQVLRKKMMFIEYRKYSREKK